MTFGFLPYPILPLGRWLPSTLFRLSGHIMLADLHLLFHYGWPSWMMSIPNYLLLGCVAVAGVSAIWEEQFEENVGSVASGGPRVITYDMAVLLLCLVLSILLGLVIFALGLRR